MVYKVDPGFINPKFMAVHSSGDFGSKETFLLVDGDTPISQARCSARS
jgi:hypothetical protein